MSQWALQGVAPKGASAELVGGKGEPPIDIASRVLATLTNKSKGRYLASFLDDKFRRTDGSFKPGSIRRSNLETKVVGEASGYINAAATPAEQVGGAGPTFDIPDGSIIRCIVDGGAPDTATFNASAALDQTAAGPFDLEPNDDLTLEIDGGAEITATVLATAAADQTAAEPFNLAAGDTLTLDLHDGNGVQTVTWDAVAEVLQSSLAGPFALADGQTLNFTINGVPFVVAFLAANVVDINAVTVDEAVTEIDAVLNGNGATTINDGGAVQITSTILGTSSQVIVTGGTAAAAFAFLEETAGSGDVANIDAVTKEEVRDRVNADTVGCTASLAGGDVVIRSDIRGTASRVEITGGAAAAVLTFDGETLGTGNVANVDAVTATELAAILNAVLVGASATVVGADCRITSDKKGTASSVVITGGLAEATLAFDGETAGAGDAADSKVVTIAELKILIEADIAGVTVNATAPLTIKTVATGAAATLEIDAATTDLFGFGEAVEDAGAAVGGSASFTGQALNSLPVMPFSVLVRPPGAADVQLYDKYGDGKLYERDDAAPDTEVEAGTVDYVTGALKPDWTAIGNSPDSGSNILVDYTQTVYVGHQTQLDLQRSFLLPSLGSGRSLRVMAQGVDNKGNVSAILKDIAA